MNGAICRAPIGAAAAAGAVRAARRGGLALAGLLLAVLALPGCSVQRLAARASAGLVADSFAAVNAEYDLELAEGGAAAGLPLLEGVLRGDPDSVEVRLLAAEAYSGYALAFVEQDDPERAVGLYRRARDHALHAWRVAARHGGGNGAGGRPVVRSRRAGAVPGRPRPPFRTGRVLDRAGAGAA